jgi:hypothetical protein
MTEKQVIEKALDLGVDELCIRTPSRYTLYAPAWHDELARLAQDAGIDISIWPVVALQEPEKEADAIREAVTRYLPVRVVLDAEIKTWIANLPRFLSKLGRLPVPVGLGSFRRPSLHPEMRWQTWWTARALSGEHVIDFVATQLYPIGWISPTNWVNQMRLDVDSNEAELQKAGRTGIPWLPWMPSFIGGTYEGQTTPWIPSAESVAAAVEFLKTRLGDRLVGLNWWSLDKNLVDIPALYAYVKSLPGEPIGPVSFQNLPEAKRWELVERGLKQQGILDAAGVPIEA